jgi:hypothetical protein
MLQAVVLTFFLSVASVLAGFAQDADSQNKNWMCAALSEIFTWVPMRT